MYILKRDEVEAYSISKPFAIYENGNYYGLFLKRNNKVRSLFSPVSLNERIIPVEFRTDKKFIYNLLSFKGKYRSTFIYLNVSKNNENLKFEGTIFYNGELKKFGFNGSSGTTSEIFRVNFIGNYNKNELISLLKALLPRKLLNVLSKFKVLYFENKAEPRIPFEIAFQNLGMFVKTIMSTNNLETTDFDLKKGYIRRVLLISNSWDERFRYSSKETDEIYSTIKNSIETQIIKDKVRIQEFISLCKDNDLLFISSHAEANGIDLGDIKLNLETVKLLEKTPRFVFLNNCYFEGMEELVRELLKRGSKVVVFSPFKVPDSWHTKFFTLTFFSTLSKTYDFDLSFYLASEVSRRKNYYNHLLYRVCV